MTKDIYYGKTITGNILLAKKIRLYFLENISDLEVSLMERSMKGFFIGNFFISIVQKEQLEI